MNCWTITRWDETSTGYYVWGESLDKTQFPASFSRKPAFTATRKGPTRPNFRGTAIMTVIFLYLKERAHFLPAHSLPSFSPTPSSPLFALRRRRECPAPAILLKPTATIAPHPFFFHLFCSCAPRSLYTDTAKLGQTIQWALTIKWDYPHVTWFTLTSH